MDFPEGNERELILQVATRLVAGLGYDGTSIQQVGEAAGLDAETIGAYFPTKRELYLEVMRKNHRIRADVVIPCSDELRTAPHEEKAAALRRFADSYLDLCLSHPEIALLWMHRWMSDASDIDLDAIDVRPMTPHIIDSMSTATDPAGADAQFITYTLVWCIHGFVLSGVLDSMGRRSGAGDPCTLLRFRRHMHQMLTRVALLDQHDDRVDDK
ncbi:transcriptional regulator, TetR family [Streptosporangium subroseum]|uniref:Transcriptional regulator, TetR family n=1 Tax=Streptosporangium subroseum TaxID=106412 RepID=A0A239LR74_9ACTN|nr:TetR/AcrR family transcriptional regulator [Streptosporangium subroseum]SNT33056.1 transcriptional regulator, TetR family [Streptosporangium subroseum]